MSRKRKRSEKAAPASGSQPPSGSPATEPPRKRRNYAKWRAISLSLVYLVFAAHIAHWKITGQSLAPLELNEVMYTLELGIITAGFLFMCFLVLGSLIFGRFFCSWACHIMVLQDFCAWLLRKVKIRAKPIRSRVLLLVPPLTAGYMFIWPQIVRAYQSQSLPTFYFGTDRDGWASFVTNNFWRNLPGPAIIILTFLVCGFLIVYLLGSRTFCTYICPYGAIFALADRFAVGRIQVTDACEQCGQCTATCTSGVRVHEEVKMHGMIVNPACMKDMDCVSGCPQGALHYGFTKPSLFRSYSSGGRFGLPYDFSVVEEVLIGSVFVTCLLTFRSLYNRFPFLLSLAMGAVIAYLCVMTVRLFTRPHVVVSKIPLKDRGRLTGLGTGFLGIAALLAAFVAHSAFIRYHEYTGLRQAAGIEREADPELRIARASLAYDRLLVSDEWGLVRNHRVEQSLLKASLQLERFDEAEGYANRLLERTPGHADSAYMLGQAQLGQGKESEAEGTFRWIVAAAPENPDKAYEHVAGSAHHALAGLLAKRGDFAAAISELEAALVLAPDRARVHAELGGALAETGRLDEAIGSLEKATQLDPELDQAQYNLGTLLAHGKRFEEAIPHYEKAVATMADDADLLNNLGVALRQTGKLDSALPRFERAIEINPDHADAHFNLGVLLAAQRKEVEANEHFTTAVRLDPRYRQFLSSE